MYKGPILHSNSSTKSRLNYYYLNLYTFITYEYNTKFSFLQFSCNAHNYVQNNIQELE